MIKKILIWLSDKFENCEHEYEDELGFCFDVNFKHVMITICPDQWKQGIKFGGDWHGWSVTASLLTVGTIS